MKKKFSLRLELIIILIAFEGDNKSGLFLLDHSKELNTHREKSQLELIQEQGKSISNKKVKAKK